MMDLLIRMVETGWSGGKNGVAVEWVRISLSAKSYFNN
jgi:hypothetical protein